MKKKIYTALFLSTLMLAGTNSFAQLGDLKGKAENVKKDAENKAAEAEQEVTEKAGEKGEAVISEIKEEINLDGKGEELKDKLTGADNSIDEAQNNVEGVDAESLPMSEAKMAKTEELNESVSQGEVKVVAAKEKVKASQDQLEKDKAEGKISEKEYTDKLGEIAKIYESIKGLEGKLELAKGLTQGLIK